MNLQEYAAHRKALGLRGTSHVAVLRAINSERLTPPAATRVGKRWVIEPALADAQWGVNTLQWGPKDAPPQALPQPVAPPPVAPPPVAPPPVAPPVLTPAPAAVPAVPAESQLVPDFSAAIMAALTAVPEGSIKTRSQADTSKLVAQAQMLWLDLGVRQGELISKDEANQAAFEEKRRARDTLKRLPLLVTGDISRIVGGLTEDQRTDVRLLIEQHVAAVLSELSSQAHLDEMANEQG